NVSDMVWINGTPYKPETLVQNQALFNFVLPDCIEGRQEAFYLNIGCYDLPIVHRFSAGTSAVTIEAMAATQVNPRHFARIAFLLDRDTPAVLHVRVSSCRFQPPYEVTFVGYAAQIGDHDQLIYTNPRNVRGVKTWGVIICPLDIGTT